jgi:hypothetical protein
LSLSDFAENEIADWLAANGAPSSVTNVYVKLHTGDPGEAGTANASAETERKEASFGAASGGVCTSDADVSWLAWDQGSESITFVSFWDNVSAGNCLGSGANSGNTAVVNGNDFVISAGDLTITLT